MRLTEQVDSWNSRLDQLDVTISDMLALALMDQLYMVENDEDVEPIGRTEEDVTGEVEEDRVAQSDSSDAAAEQQRSSADGDVSNPSGQNSKQAVSKGISNVKETGDS